MTVGTPGIRSGNSTVPYSQTTKRTKQYDLTVAGANIKAIQEQQVLIEEKDDDIIGLKSKILLLTEFVCLQDNAPEALCVNQ